MSLDDLRAAPAANATMIYNGDTFTWSLRDYSKPPLGPADDITIVKQSDTSLITGAWVRQFGFLSVRAFGAVSGPAGDPTVNAAAFKKALATASKLGMPLDLEGGDYLLDAGSTASGPINFAYANLRIKGSGATLRFRGAGRAFVLDHGAKSGSFIEGMSVDDITIIGEPGVTDGFYMRGVVRSAFRNIDVVDVGGKAFWIKHGVSCHFDCLKYSAHKAGHAAPQVAATHGIYIDNNDTKEPSSQGYYTANCIFTNAVMEGFSGIGCHIADGSGNIFIGGTFEACATGLFIDRRSTDNTFVRIWMEANAVADAVIYGDNNGFVGARMMSSSLSGPNIRVMADCRGTCFAGGGYVRHVDLATGSSDTSFHQVGVDQNLSGSIGFQGSGSYTRIGCKKIGPTNNVVGTYEDILGSVAALGVSGVWMPVLMSTRGSIIQNAQHTQGAYHKIGKLVFAQCSIYIDSVRSPAGSLSITGLPFISAWKQAGSVHVTQLQTSANDMLQVRVEPDSMTLLLSKLSAGADVDAAADVRENTTIAVSITYTVAD